MSWLRFLLSLGLHFPFSSGLAFYHVRKTQECGQVAVIGLLGVCNKGFKACERRHGSLIFQEQNKMMQHEAQWLDIQKDFPERGVCAANIRRGPQKG